MRRIFRLVLVLLLVLRALMGTAMAAGMLPALPADVPAHTAQQLHQTHASDNIPALGAGMVLTADNSMDFQDKGVHIQCYDPASGPCDGSSHADSPLCSACEICHSAALLPRTPGTLPHSGAVETQPGPTARFASAAAVLALKPPIA